MASTSLLLAVFCASLLLGAANGFQFFGSGGSTSGNGTMMNGTMMNGTMTNGTMTNGTMMNGTMMNGTMTNGTMTRGTMTDGTMMMNGTGSSRDVQLLIRKVDERHPYFRRFSYRVPQELNYMMGDALLARFKKTIQHHCNVTNITRLVVNNRIVATGDYDVWRLRDEDQIEVWTATSGRPTRAETLATFAKGAFAKNFGRDKKKGGRKWRKGHGKGKKRRGDRDWSDSDDSDNSDESEEDDSDREIDDVIEEFIGEDTMDMLKGEEEDEMGEGDREAEQEEDY